MPITTQEIERRMTHFETVCRDKGIKRTHQRIEIFREVAQAEDHPDAEQIFQRVQKRMPTVSLDTVYRTLWLLHELGLVITLHSGRERTHFDANLEKHHHFVCEHCGFTRDFHCSDLDRIRLPDVLKNFGKVKTAQVEARGLCKACLLKK